MKMEYFEHWGSHSKKGIGKLSQEEAYSFHKKEKPYVGVITKDDTPQYIVEVKFNFKVYFCGVLHLHENLRSRLSEAFEWRAQKLFLKNVKKRYIDGGEISLVTYLYETDGTYRKNFFINGKGTNTPEYGECDVSSHFREMIQFGNYDSILPEEAKKGLQEG
ncbi:hypothetical protein [Mechercharimyces sp. CAU 1602]|uniref:hypothetical protein n=1 Tax=Mechercharimyces sp. CAU 1602 TaxID=2973933 RepID=UPI0021618EB6|nr:hypothetical protein [Mechercharimyces sp. CAU 1602]MCS1351697.1 hypothetical protein [Mechercharimyces sp. CAU 1602]